MKYVWNMFIDDVQLRWASSMIIEYTRVASFPQSSHFYILWNMCTGFKSKIGREMQVKSQQNKYTYLSHVYFTYLYRLYRLKQRRQLGNLFTNDKTSGCTVSHPGIGDVMYVKDVLTESIATSSLKCSIFGPHTHPNLGWVNIFMSIRENLNKSSVKKVTLAKFFLLFF